MSNGESAGLESADSGSEVDAVLSDGRPGPHGYRGQEKAPQEDCACQWCEALRAHLERWGHRALFGAEAAQGGEEAEERQRGSEGVHGIDPPQAEVIELGDGSEEG